MKTLRILIRLDAVLLAFFGFLTASYTRTETVRIFGPGGMHHRFEQDQAPLLFLGTAVVVLAIVLFMVSGFALIGHRRKLGTLLAAGNLAIAVTVAASPSSWTSFMGWIPALILLIMAVALAGASWRPLDPDGAAAELAALQIPDDIRQAMLRQIGEAAAQEERNRLARDLHDSIKQQLFTINVSTAAAQELWERDPERAQGALADVRRSAKEAMVEMQALLHQLTPRALTSAGLIEALREQCEALGYRTGAEVTLELGEAIPDDQLSPGAQETLFRIAQEALSNVARHARAGNVRVWLGGSSGAVWLRIQDDGQGFQPEQATSGMGMRNLKERAESLRGNLVVTSAPKKGTTVEVRIPFNPQPLPKTPIQKAIETERFSLTILGISAMLFLGDPTFLLHGFNVVILLLLLFRSWWNARDTTLHDAPREAVSLLSYEIHRHRALSFLLAAWWAPWHWRLQEEGWTSGRYAWLALAGIALFLAVLELGRVHKVSRFKIRWPIASEEVVMPGLVAVLGLALMIYVFLTVFLFIRNQNGDLALLQSFSIQLLFLTTTLPVFVYVLTRQPRTEGAAS